MLDYETVIKGNIAVHQKEAQYYDLIHNEIWNRSEQKRLHKLLRILTSQIEKPNFRALDFGAGTGNITQKLLNIGYSVTAIDISPDMCERLKKKEHHMVDTKRLEILNLNIDKAEIAGDFDLVTSYSVIHHLPNYLKTIEKLADLVKPGGILYFDHEQPDADSSLNAAGKLILRLYYFTDEQTSAVYKKFHGLNLPQIDYSLADVHLKLDWAAITHLLNEKGFEVQIIPHYVNDSRVYTPLSYLRKIVLKANSAMLIAKKTREISAQKQILESHRGLGEEQLGRN
ncbi:MAG: class I SAM-dependent methyltransferase [Candidatus Bathyarchaeota archaeon]|nr:class I SAM-dependent methyltransferase [Candidatus Bathyarchaeota archaeon]